jgi:alpha-mannosidase
LDLAYEYPAEEFTHAWQLVCLNQFHDIIPGSSIGPVYEESLAQYGEVRKIVANIRNEALKRLSAQMGSSSIVVNPTSFKREEVIEIRGESGKIVELPPYSISSVHHQNVKTPRTSLSISQNHIENQFIRIELNGIGDITRIFDKIAAREILPENTIGNQFLAFEDIPLNWDAWDVEIFYDDKIWLAYPATSISVVESSPYRAILEIKRRILNSFYSQRISLSSLSARLDFDTHIDWRERQILLKVAFPIDVLTPIATYEIQWGNVERPTHRNSSWDWARFETAAQKWVDLSEGNYGVSLLNDCKYGHDIHDNVIRLTLLRGTTAPDPEADLGEHRFMYSLYPHIGNWGAETVREAYSVNDPIILYTADDRNHQGEIPLSENYENRHLLPPLAMTDVENIVIETIKRAEDGVGVIVRLYEFQRHRGPFALETSFPMVKAWRINILEENQEEIPVEGNKLHYSIKPYQILTLRLIPDQNLHSGE